MSSCLVVYFSQGGTTRRTAEAISRGLRAAGHSVDLHDLRDGAAPDPAGYDLLGVGGPAHYYRPALVVSDYVERLPTLSGKPVFSFALHGAYPGDAGTFLRRALAARGGRELGYARFRGAGNFLGYLRRGYLFSPAQPGPDAIARAERFGAELAARLAGGANAPEADDPPTPAVYRLERLFTSALLVRHFYSRLFRIDGAKCIGCGRCKASCPTSNIRDDRGGRRSFGRDCILCFACEAGCPKGAISAPVTWALFSPFMLYNTGVAARDPAIGHERVVHTNGRTRAVAGREPIARPP